MNVSSWLCLLLSWYRHFVLFLYCCRVLTLCCACMPALLLSCYTSCCVDFAETLKAIVGHSHAKLNGVNEGHISVHIFLIEILLNTLDSFLYTKQLCCHLQKQLPGMLVALGSYQRKARTNKLSKSIPKLCSKKKLSKGFDHSTLRLTTSVQCWSWYASYGQCIFFGITSYDNMHPRTKTY